MVNVPALVLLNLPLEGRSKSRSDFGRGVVGDGGRPPSRNRLALLAAFDLPSRGRFDQEATRARPVGVGA